MRRSASTLLSLPVLAAALIPGPASALTDTLTTTVVEAAGEHAGLFLEGSSFHVHFETDESVADTDPESGSGVFPAALVSLTVTFENEPSDGSDDIVLSAGAGNGVSTSEHLLIGLMIDGVELVATQGLTGSVGGLAIVSLTVGLVEIGPSPSLVVNDAIGTPPLAVQTLAVSFVSSDGFTTEVRDFRLVVPEPGAATLLGGGLLAAASRRRAFARRR